MSALEQSHVCGANLTCVLPFVTVIDGAIAQSYRLLAAHSRSSAVQHVKGSDM